MASVLITGTSRGIGLETALAFGRAGHKVHATMRNPERSPQTRIKGRAREVANRRLRVGRGLWLVRHGRSRPLKENGATKSKKVVKRPWRQITSVPSAASRLCFRR